MSAPSRSEIQKSGVLRPDDEESVCARTLCRLATVVPGLEGVWKHDARRGDWIIVRTRNSTYSIAVQDDLTVVVSGGWFKGNTPDEGRVHVTGCTWGGSAILTGMMAAPGMCIEFSNGVRTTRVRNVQVIRDVGGRAH